METATGDLAVAIIGGGICGVMAGARCIREGLSFVILERGEAYGGNWIVRANSYSHLQVGLCGHRACTSRVAVVGQSVHPSHGICTLM